MTLVPDVRLRQATHADLPVISRLVRDYHALEPVDVSPAAVDEAARILISDDSLGRIWLIELNADTVVRPDIEPDTRRVAEPVGYAALAFGFSLAFAGRDGFIDELFVKEECRGRGIGRQALHLVCQQAHSLGLKALHLEVSRTNHSAKALYAELGFSDRQQFQLMSLMSITS